MTYIYYQLHYGNSHVRLTEEEERLLAQVAQCRDEKGQLRS